MKKKSSLNSSHDSSSSSSFRSLARSFTHPSPSGGIRKRAHTQSHTHTHTDSTHSSRLSPVPQQKTSAKRNFNSIRHQPPPTPRPPNCYATVAKAASTHQFRYIPNHVSAVYLLYLQDRSGPQPADSDCPARHSPSPCSPSHPDAAVDAQPRTRRLCSA